MDHYNKPLPQVYLTHHGILGQKWGERNGPPYPLDVKDHSATEKKARWRKSLDKGTSREDNKKKGLTDKKQKRALKIGATLAAVALATYGTYKLADSGELHRLAEKGKAFIHGSPPQWRKHPFSADPNMSADEIFVNIVSRIKRQRIWHAGAFA